MMPTEKMRELARRPQGVATDEVPMVARKEASSIGSRLCKRGELHRAVVRGIVGVRYFASLHDRAVWLAANRVVKGATQKQRRMVEQPLARPISGKGPAHLPGEPVITAKTRITRAPAPPEPTRTNTYSVAA